MRRGAVHVAALSCVAAALVGLPPASAAVTLAAPLRVAATSARDSTSSRSVTVACPDGTRVIDAGGQVNGATGQVVLDDYTPDRDLRTVTASAFEREDGYAGFWSLTAYALCAVPPPGLYRAAFASVTNSSSTKTVLNGCSFPDEMVIGTGVVINGARGQAWATEVDPFGNGFSAIGRATEDPTGFDGDWTMTVNAICAKVPPGDISLVTGTSLYRPATASTVTGTCPVGTVGTGGGFDIVAENGDRDAGPSAVPAAVRPAVHGRSHTATAWALPGFTGDWNLRSTAVCLRS